MKRDDRWVGGLVLIAIGIAALLAQVTDDLEQYVLLGLGVVLLLLFAVSRNPGALIGGSIVTGLGIGVIIAATREDAVGGAAVLFGLGFGFLAIWFVGRLFRMKETAFWPLIPGGILVAIGFVVLAGTDAAEAFTWLWPILLIALGVIVLVGTVAGRLRGPDDQPPTPR